MKETWLRDELKRYYSKLLGELVRIDRPPKRLLRLEADREAYEREAPAREARRASIIEALPHLVAVVKLFDPDWDNTTAKPIRPRHGSSGLPSQGGIGSAMEILREAAEPMTVREIVRAMAARHDLDIGSSAAYQKLHTVVHNGLTKTHRDFVECVGGKPKRWRVVG